MNNLENALLAITRTFTEMQIPYMIIGGMANVIWGESRSTLDIDITIWSKETQIERIVAQLSKEFHVIPKRPIPFIHQSRVLPLDTKEGARIDVIFGLSPFEEEAIRRSIKIPIAGVPINFCTPEDLLLFKLISDREKDQEDAKHIFRRQKDKLDRPYLELHLKELARALKKPHLLEKWHAGLSGKNQSEEKPNSPQTELFVL